MTEDNIVEEEYKPSMFERIIPLLNEYNDAQLMIQMITRKKALNSFDQQRIRRLRNKKINAKRKIIVEVTSNN